MKHIVLMILTLSISIMATAQPTAEIKSAMRKLSFFSGNWKGTGLVNRGPGNQLKIDQEENIGFKLDSTVLVIEGIGRNPMEENAIVFNAIGIITYVPSKKEYEMRSYLKEGQKTDAYFRITGNNTYEWGFDVPQGKIKYEIVHDVAKKTWVENGFFSKDGSQWWPTIAMELVKQ